ncbi:uncharacterized protein LOC111499794 [Cucurbita maxima]|uniref:Uncharacterized protein LOC111499794 n=1 Tax=Cucurbita maxima TaxID=3661 RepID=A0A6J1L4F9_CUCMA|nr:uncharacterized protein LOC111499794 [Cucurbita maxima]
MAALNRKRRNICIAVLLSLIVLVILILILAFTVFKPKQPTITVDSVSLLDLNISLNAARFGVDLNLTLIVQLTVENPNKVAFQHSDGTAVVSYRGEEVAEAPIPSGRLSPDGTEKMNLTLTMMADRLLAKSELFSDVIAGELPISTFARLAGKMTVIGVFKIRVVALSSCDLTIDIRNRSVEDQRCEYRTKL